MKLNLSIFTGILFSATMIIGTNIYLKKKSITNIGAKIYRNGIVD